MSPYSSVVMLILWTGLLLVIPMAPAIIELYRKTDAQPLLVLQKHAGEIRHFSEGFRGYVNELNAVRETCRISGTTARGTLKDGAEYFVMSDSAALLPEIWSRGGKCSTVVIACADLCAPRLTLFSREIHAQGNFVGGDHNEYRAILGDKDVHLGAHSIVMRWVHAAGTFNANHDCDLHGRVSSDTAIHLGDRCTFLRLNAPRIELGPSSTKNNNASNAVASAASTYAVLKRYLHDQDFEIQANHVFHGNIVTRGRFIAHRGAQIFGSVKSSKSMVLEDDVLVTGSAISSGQLRIGRNCCLHGPVIAERVLYIDSGARLGTSENPTTVSSPKIYSKEDVLIFGTLWAREHGEVAREG